MDNHKLSPRGIVEITATDEITGIVRKVTDKNVCVNMLGTMQSGSWHFGSLHMQIDARKFAKNARNQRFRGPGYQQEDSTNSLFRSEPFDLHLNDWYCEETFVFNAPGVDRDINSIFMTVTAFTSNHGVEAAIALDNTFVQGATELLSIKYRFVVNTSSLTANEALRIGYALYGTFNYYNTSTVYYTRIIRGILEYMGENTESETFTLNEVDNQVDDITANSNLSTTGISMSWDKTDHVGRYVAGYGELISIHVPGQPTADHNIPFKVPQLLDKDNHDGVPNYPLGPLFNHSSDATSYFEDVNNLASGKGYPLVSCIPEPSFEMSSLDIEGQRFNIVKSGNVGVSRFDVKIETIPGRGLASTRVVPNASRPSVYGFTKGTHASYVDVIDNVNTHVNLKDKDVHPIGNIIGEYNSDWIIHSRVNKDKLSIAFVGSLDHSILIGFDSLTTPALPTANVRSLHRVLIARNWAGDFFYLTDDGFVVIRDPLGTPTIESKSMSDLGATASTISRISVNGDLIQFTTESELIYSVDNGVSWVVVPCVNIPRGSSPRMVGGDINNPTKILVTDQSTDLSWFDATTDVLTAVVGYDGYDLKGYFDSVSNKYYVAYRTDAYREFQFIGEWGQTDIVAASHYDSSTFGSQGRTDPSKLVRLKQGGLAILNPLPLATATMQLYTIDGISTRVPVLMASDSYNYANMSYYLSSPVNFMIELFDEVDGLPPNHFKTQSTYYKGATADSEYLIYYEAHNNSDLYSLNSHFSKTYRWDSDASEWKKGWNKSASATSGSSVSKALRVGFETDSNAFYKGSRLDITDAINDGSYTTNGFSLLVTATEAPKVTGTVPASWKAATTHQDNPLACIMELSEPSTGQSIALMHCGYSNQLSIIDYTDTGTYQFTETDLGVTPATSTVRYCFVLNATGTTVTLYMNGVIQGSAVTLNAPFNLAGTLQCNVGTRNYGIDRAIGHCSPFTGELSNVLVYEKALTGTEALTDSGTPSGTAVAGDLVVQYSMTEDYLEGKLTSATSQVCINDVEIAFPEGDLTGDSYVAGDDYFCVKATRGIIKDNATTVTFGTCSGLHYHKVNEITSPHTGLTTFTAGATPVVDMPLVFQQGTSTSYRGHNVGSPSPYSDYSYDSGQGLTGDVDFTWEDFCPTGYGYIYLGDRDTSRGSVTPYTYSLLLTFNTDSVTLTGSGISEVISHTREVNDKWKLSVDETLDIVTLSWWDGTTWVQKNVTTITYSNLAVNTGAKHLVVQPDSTVRPLSIGNATGSGDWMGNVMYIGDPVSDMGAYSKSFMGMVHNTVPLTMMKVTIDGVPQTRINKTSSHGSATTGIADSGGRTPDINEEPPVGSYYHYSCLGMFVFNSSEAGKTVAIQNAMVADSGSVDDL